ncbi:MAG: hypothetical protein J0I06_01300 [Planctomycetes bacterium]|nr:hypothetical protein [Planctomycetota bacterium]
MAKVKSPKKPTKKPKVTARVAVRVARPNITSPVANADVPPGEDLGVSANVNVGDLRYQIELTDVTGDPPFPTPFVTDATVVGGVATGVIPAAQLPAGHTFRIRVLVNPADGSTPPNLDHTITITTTGN